MVSLAATKFKRGGSRASGSRLDFGSAGAGAGSDAGAGTGKGDAATVTEM